MSDPAPPERAHSSPGGTLQPPASHRPSRGPAPGQRIGSLELVARIGSGGMGEVWEARDLELDRLVAVKLMAPELSAPNAAQRFRREARAAAAIHHPHVALVYFAGVHEGRLFYVMEHVAGTSLERWLRERGRLPARRALDLLRQAAEGLRAAQRAGVIHRDLKPANLMVDERWQLKIVDFGLARGELDTTLTREGAVLGTPTYMAPEQARGREVDHRADVYALGATFYHLLCGRPPFSAAGPLQLAERHVSTPLPPLAGRAPDLPPPLCALVERMLAKEPAGRFQSYDELLVELAAVAEKVGRPSEEEPGQPQRSSRRAAVAVLAALLAGAGLLAAWLGGWPGAGAGPGPAAGPGAAPPFAVDPGRRAVAEETVSAIDPALGAGATDESGLDETAASEVPFPLDALVPDAARAEGISRDATAETMWRLSSAIAAFTRDRGRAPRTLDEVAAAHGLPREALRDGWGTLIRLERTGTRGGPPFLLSAGPDGRAGTADDLFFVAGRLRSAPAPSS